MTDCQASIGFPQAVTFGGTFSEDPGSPAGALCRAAGPIMYGSRNGVRFGVEDSSDGAVLGGCGPSCTARSRTVITGDVLPDLTNPTGFTGALVEQLTRTDGSCDACALPCAARYALDGQVVEP